MKRGSVVGINDDPGWAQVSEYDADMAAHHWAELVEIDLPGAATGEPALSVIVERFDQVMPDEVHQVVGDYSFVLRLHAAEGYLRGPSDLDALADDLRHAAVKLRSFITAEDVTRVAASAPTRASGEA